MKREFALWTAILVPPAAWFLNLTANFALAPFACGYHWDAALNAVSLVCLAVSAACGLLAWKQWREVGEGAPGEGSGAARPRIMALGGLALSSMFALVIVAQALVQLILGACG